MGFTPPQPARRRRVRRTPPLVWAVLATVALHAGAVGLFALLAVLGAFDRELVDASRVPPPKPQSVGMRTLTPDEWAKNRGEQAQDPKALAQRDPQRPRPEPKPKAPEDRPEGQIVDVAPGNEEVDPDAKYVAESSNRADKQTRAKEQTPHYRNAMPRSTTTTPQSSGESAELKAPDGSGNEGLGNDDRPLQSTEQKLAVEVPDVKARDEVQLDAKAADEGEGPSVANREESLALEGNSQRLRLVPGQPSDAQESSEGRAGKAGQMALMPSLSVLDNVVGGAPSDHLDEAEGEGTFLSTKEWKHAGFFNRVKQSVGMTWNPGVELRRRDPSGNMYGARDRHTVLTVTIDRSGSLKEVFVAKSCGLDFLDLEAVRSFERAQPFPNPPPAMLGSQSTVSFQFGFFVQMDSGGIGRTRMFRQQ